MIAKAAAALGFPIWVIYLIVGLLSTGTLYGAHALYSSHYYQAGKQACEDARGVLDQNASAAQGTQAAAADKDLAVEKTVTEKVYVDKIKEVIRYVPSKEAGDCLADADFIRLYNESGGTGQAATQ